MNNPTNFLIDARSEEDIRRQIKKLAAAYTPEWEFGEANPDIGSVIGLIYARQMSGNIKRLNQVLDKYQTEFVNMLGLNLLPAYPAHGVAVLELLGETVPGVELPRGTKLMGSSAEAEGPVIFETLSDVFITRSRLTDILAVSGHFGKIIPICGRFRTVELVPEDVPPGPPETEEATWEIPPVSLFDYSGQGVGKNALMLYHGSIFDTIGGVSVSVRMFAAETGENLADALADPSRYRWSYYGDDGMTPFDEVFAEDGVVFLKKTGENRKLIRGGRPLSMICIEALGVVSRPVNLSRLQISSAGGPAPAEFVVHNAEELDVNDFMPFGDSASLFDECYIGYDSVFSQQGAMITMHFSLDYRDKLVSLTPLQEQENLKIIKPRARAVLFDTANTAVQRVSIDYFNGTGWRRLQCVQDRTTVFDGSYSGGMDFSFICPDDWQPVVTGGFFSRCLRIRVKEADNCYLRPCIHKMPRVSGLRLSYTYFGEWHMPHRVERVWGTERADLSLELAEGKPFAAFSPLPYTENAMYLGFNYKMEGAPISILFDVEESVNFQGSRIRFEYSTVAGFQQLKVIDHTDNMSRAGTILFLPQADFAPAEVEGNRRYWIRMVDEANAYADPDRYHAVLRRIMPNAAEIHNVETLQEEAFFIDVATPNMSFPIAARNILSAEVFVNELDRLTVPVMRRMMEQSPEDVRAELNFIGEIESFYVRWTEVDSFDGSTPADRHYRLDRMDSTIHFGDGVNVMIPSASSGDPAFTLRAKCCAGELGNLPAGAVDSSFGMLLYVGGVSNPIPTYAGSGIESIESAHLRGANMVSSKNRLVSERDFVRETLAFSSSVEKVRCVIGGDVAGRRDDRLVSIAVLMSDYKDGSYSFHSLRDRLSVRLLEKCDASLAAGMLLITEPVFVEISVDVWAETASMDHFFLAQNAIRDQIGAFLDPIGKNGGEGWPIGRLPTHAQLSMLLGSVKCNANVLRFIATARYIDQSGAHERDLSTFKGGAFMICTNGRHNVHMQLKR